MSDPINRRRFLQFSLGAATSALTMPALADAALKADAPASPAAGPFLKKAVKFEMIKTPGSIEDKFNLIKSIGFLGVEMDSPSNIDRDEAVKARDKTGIAIHGVIDSVHWKIRLSDPDPAVRAKGLEALKTALNDAHTYGATTVLLVPGQVTNDETESFEQVWSRSQEQVRTVLPLAEKLNVKIAIEVVGNNFLKTPEQMVKYIDEFKTPFVGGYFDVSNVVRWGFPSSAWVRALDKRLLKFDFKGRSKTKVSVPIGEGDEDWPEVIKALKEVGYHGWATAETAGGGEKELRDVAERMNRVLELG